MNNKDIQFRASIDQQSDGQHFQHVSLHVLRQIQDLVMEGYSQEEAEKMVEAKELTLKEREWLLKQAVKEAEKDLKAHERHLKREREQEVAIAIFNKRMTGF